MVRKPKHATLYLLPSGQRGRANRGRAGSAAGRRWRSTLTAGSWAQTGGRPSGCRWSSPIYASGTGAGTSGREGTSAPRAVTLAGDDRLPDLYRNFRSPKCHRANLTQVNDAPDFGSHTRT
jgi:hypothetical protein